MPKCGLCGGEAPRLPSITEDGKCDLCGKAATLAEEPSGAKKEESGQGCQDKPGCCK